MYGLYELAIWVGGRIEARKLERLEAEWGRRLNTKAASCRSGLR